MSRSTSASSLVKTFFGRLVKVAKTLGGDLAVKAEAVGSGHFIGHFLDFMPVRFKCGGLFGEFPVGILQMAAYPLTLAEKELQFVLYDFLQVRNGELVTALSAEVFVSSGADGFLLFFTPENGDAADESTSRKLCGNNPR